MQIGEPWVAIPSGFSRSLPDGLWHWGGAAVSEIRFPCICLRMFYIFPCSFKKDKSITTGHIFDLSRGLKQTEVSE